MNTEIRRTVGSILSSFIKPFYTPVRYRYHAEKIARGPIIKKFGYKDPIFQQGVLPRLKDDKPLPLPKYRPVNSWSEKRALKGQNDYIDLLGGGKLNPALISYDVPKWLRARKGNEFQLLLVKHRILSRTNYRDTHPTDWYNINRRLRYLYKYLNTKTKTYFMHD